MRRERQKKLPKIFVFLFALSFFISFSQHCSAEPALPLQIISKCGAHIARVGARTFQGPKLDPKIYVETAAPVGDLSYEQIIRNLKQGGLYAYLRQIKSTNPQLASEIQELISNESRLRLSLVSTLKFWRWRPGGITRVRLETLIKQLSEGLQEPITSPWLSRFSILNRIRAYSLERFHPFAYVERRTNLRQQVTIATDRALGAQPREWDQPRRRRSYALGAGLFSFNLGFLTATTALGGLYGIGIYEKYLYGQSIHLDTAQERRALEVETQAVDSWQSSLDIFTEALEQGDLNKPEP